MRIDEVIRSVSDAVPITDAEVSAFDFELAEAELIDEITTLPGMADIEAVGTHRPQRQRSRWRRRAAGALVGIAAAGALVIVATQSLGGGNQPAFAAEAIRVAESNARLLVTAPGWRVTRADQFSVENGDITFSNGEHQLDLTWYPAEDYKSFYRDRNEVDPDPTFITLLGEKARMVQYGPRPEFATMLPPQGPTFVEIRGLLGSREEYLEVLKSIQPTDVNTWLSAMPPSTVQPDERTAMVNEMLQGIPLPPGFDSSKLERGDLVSDRYHLGATVTQAVTCGWLDSWTEAKASGNEAAAKEAVDAMATAESWPILQEMASEGGWSVEVWRYARVLARGNVEKSAFDQEMNCIEF